MPALFWIDVTASSFATLISAALVLIVLAAGLKNSINRHFALFMFIQAVWGCLSNFMRLSLWLQKGNPQFFAELNALALFFMGFFLLSFSVRYVGRPTRVTDIWIAAGMVAAAALSPFNFSGMVVSNPRLHDNGTTLVDVSLLGILFSLLPLIYYAWSFVVFWRERKRTGETYMAYSVLIILAGFMLGGVAEIHFPVQSFTHSLSIALLGYGVLSRQLFNPLKRHNEILQKEIMERRKAESALKLSLGEKELLLKEIHHRVKNNLQIITSMLRLQSEKINDKRLRDVFTDSRHRIQSMALIHELLYQTPNFSNIPFSDYVMKLANSLYRTYHASPNKIELSVSVKVANININKAIPCGLIINEIISNSLKYAFPESYRGKPKISLSMRVTPDHHMHMVVKDNGLGLPKDLDVRKAKSLGMELIRILAEDQLCGKLDFHGRRGTCFHITFPI